MIDTVLDYLNNVDSLAAIEYLNRHDEPLAVMDTYAKLVTHLYWEARNLAAMIALARAGMQYGLTTAAATPEADLAIELKSKAKGIAYNLASFTWPGWAEPGFDIDPSALAVGLDAAKVNVRLAKELDKGDLPLSRAYWMLGGHYLAGGHLSQAETCFNQAESYAAAAKVTTEQLLARGFSLMAVMLASPDKVEAQNQLEQVKHSLAGLEHGQDFVDQIETAWRVLISG